MVCYHMQQPLDLLDWYVCLHSLVPGILPSKLIGLFMGQTYIKHDSVVTRAPQYIWVTCLPL